MRRLVFGLVSLSFLVALSPAAQAAVPRGISGTMTIDPTSGPVGTVITVSGDNCATKGDLFVDVTATNTVEGMKTVDPDFSGDWSTTFTVADDAPVGATVVVDAVCRFNFLIEDAGFQSIRAGTDPTFFAYSPQTFTVTASPSTSDPTTTSTTGGTTTSAPGAVDSAGAARPVIAEPTFTG